MGNRKTAVSGTLPHPRVSQFFVLAGPLNRKRIILDIRELPSYLTE